MNNKKGLVLAVMILIAILLIAFAYGAPTFISNPNPLPTGQCHSDRKCDIGQICYHTCIAYSSSNQCIMTESVGTCTNYCNSDADCGSGTCENSTIWGSLSSETVEMCVPAGGFTINN